MFLCRRVFCELRRRLYTNPSLPVLCPEVHEDPPRRLAEAGLPQHQQAEVHDFTDEKGEPYGRLETC
jgi:hypothetical protein